MNAIVNFVVGHGYPILFAAVFARQMGLPIPAPGFLLAAGALAASGKLGLVPALALGVTGCVLADWLWYEAGRAWGQRVLSFIHHFARDPEAADRKSRKMFARHGPALLVLDKFVPGLDAVVPPLAGITRITRFHFLALETVGAVLWSSAYVGIGYIFSENLEHAAACLGKAGTLVACAIVSAVLIYAIRKRVHWRRSKRQVGVVRLTD